MFLCDVINLSFKDRKLTNQYFPNCRNLINYLNLIGIFNAKDLEKDINILKQSGCYELEINLFLAYFVLDYVPKNTNNQVFLTELIIHLFFKNGFDLMNEREIKVFYKYASSYFPTCFPLYKRKTVGAIVRKSKHLIAYKQGGYIHIQDVIGNWDIQTINLIIAEIEFRLLTSREIEPKGVFDKYKKILAFSKIDNSHYMFSVLRHLDKRGEIDYYRNTFNSKFRRKEK